MRSDPKSSAAYEAIERYTLDSVIADLAADPPKVVIVDTHRDPRFGEVEFQYLPFFLKDPRFARFWSRYDRFATVQIEGIGPVEIFLPRPAAISE